MKILSQFKDPNPTQPTNERKQKEKTVLVKKREQRPIRQLRPCS